MTKRPVLVTLALLGVLSLACANVGRIDGRVVNHMTGEPVDGATVTVDGTTVMATTDVGGNYRLTRVVPGAQTVTATRTGFTDVTHVSVAVGGRTTVEAQATELLPYPPREGVFSYKDGVLTPLGVPAGGGGLEKIYSFRTGDWVGVQMAKMPRAKMPVVTSPLTLIARGSDDETFSVEQLSKGTTGGRSFMMNTPIVQYWRFPAGAGLPFEETAFPGGLRVLSGVVEPGVYAVAEISLWRASFFSVGPEI